MNVNYDDLKGLELVGLKKVSTYHVSTVVCLVFLLSMIIVTFFYVIIPLHNVILNIGFILGVIGGIYNIILEFSSPERHLHWTFKVPEDYRGWQYLFFTATCIDYEPKTNIITLRFNNDIDEELYNFIMMLEEEQKTQK